MDRNLVDDTESDIARMIEEGRGGMTTAFGYPPRFYKPFAAELAAFGRPITVFAAGASIGTEVYCLAMHLHEAGVDGVRILATDASEPSVRVGERACYSWDKVMANVKPPALAQLVFGDNNPKFPYRMFGRYFDPVARGWVRVAEEIRSMVEWLPPAWAPDSLVDHADVIGIRNIWRHIHPDQRIELVEKIDAALPDDGLVWVRKAFDDELPFDPAGTPYTFKRPAPDAIDRLRNTAMREGEDWLHTVSEAGDEILMTPERQERPQPEKRGGGAL